MIAIEGIGQAVLDHGVDHLHVAHLSRRRANAPQCGAIDIDSWPPATMIFASPSAICCMPSATARRPEPQSWLTPHAVASLGMPAFMRRLAGRVLALASRENLAENDFVDFAGLDAGTLQRALMAAAPSSWAGTCGEGAIERADGACGLHWR